MTSTKVQQTSEKTSEWWAQGVRFECQGSGQCCVSHGEFGFVWMTLEDRRRMAAALKMTTSAFTRKYCLMTDGLYRLKDGANEACVFLKEKRCTAYKGRPTQCRTWPFWPEVMNAKTWKTEVARFCPGVGRGRVHSAQEIEAALAEQRRSEEILVSGG
ncbi:MAG: YkgJ family cysteine cluster protein [Bdellovibrionaceae bacterium]|nr:YkgJ family cysteine cluster protein [Pseudobdellovibrionaceae bacterium]